MRKENIKKVRIDKLIFEKGLAESRSKAQALVMSGAVFIDKRRIDKPGTLVNPDSDLFIKDDKKKFVSRGGLKLEHVLDYFKIATDGVTALDIGASTGGFTDCLLQRGARKVFAFDVGHGQFDWKLRNDERVVVKEKINCRYLKFDDVGEYVDIVVIDVSFISLTLIIPPAIKLLKVGGILIALIKPQFEAEKGEVGKGGVVKDEDRHVEIVQKILSFIDTLEVSVKGVIQSPIKGADGNKEFLVCAVKD